MKSEKKRFRARRRRMKMLTRCARGIGVHLASLLAARTLLGARGLTARNQKLLVTRASLLDSKFINI